MMERYLAVIPLGNQISMPLERFDAVARESGLITIHTDAGLLLAVTPDTPVAAIGGEGGYVLGVVHARDGSPAASREVTESRIAQAVLDSAALVTRFWGNYIAILRPAGGSVSSVLRAPFGALPCLHVDLDGDLLLASDLELLRRAGMARTSIDEHAMVQRMAYRDLQRTETCLAGVRNLPGGRLLAIAEGTATNVQAWSPWDVAGKARWCESREEAGRIVRSAIMTAVRACRADAANPLLLLSGGLDSSIMAACLSSLGGGFSSINLVRRDSIGDERRYAQAVTRHLGTSLVESEWSLGHVDLLRADGSSPEPNARFLMQSTNWLVAEAAEAVGADMTIDGGGGDNAFLGIATVAPVTDALLYGETLGEAWQTAKSIALLANTSVPRVLRRGAMRVLRRPRSYRRHRHIDLLSAEAAATVPLLADHPWLQAPSSAEAGTAAHIALFASAQSWAEARDLASPLRHASPLATQPVIEACLRAPSWWWFRGGTSRIIARDAFADRLPHEIVTRRTKGAPDSFAGDIYGAHRITIREMLLDGHLARRGLVDREAIARLTDTPAPLSDNACERVLYLAQVEAWISTLT